MSKVYCVECNLVYLESEIKRLHEQSQFKNHKFMKENQSMEIIEILSKKIKSLEEQLSKKFDESLKVEESLGYMIQENRTGIHMFRSENKTLKLKPKFELLNCKYSMGNDSKCEIFRTKNIIYMKIEFNGKIEEKEGSGRAVIGIKMPMWLIYSGSFNIETLSNCLSRENKIESLCTRYEQSGNHLKIYINKDEFDTQTYWNQNNNSKFIINGNFLIEPPSIIKLRKYYLYNLSQHKILCVKNNSLSKTDKWEEGCLLEICDDNQKSVIKVNGKYLNLNNGFIKLENNNKTSVGLKYIPGFADMAIISLSDGKNISFLELVQDKVVTGKEINEKCQFILIPELKEGKKEK